jgi:hypothetical protein
MMIYEAILKSAYTNMEIFHELRGEILDIKIIHKELNYFYKYDKETWILKRVKAIKREKEKEEEEEEEKQSDVEVKQKQKRVDPGAKEQEQKQYQEIRISQHKTDDILIIEEESCPNKDSVINLSPWEIEDKSRHDYAAYAYLVLKVRLEHPISYKLINVFPVHFSHI